MQEYTSPVITLGPENTVDDAIRLMQKKDIKRIVIAENDFPVGIVTERDIGKFIENDETARTLDKIPLVEIMSTNLVYITADQSDYLNQCAIRMETFQISSVIAIDESGKLIGITTKSDLVKNFAKVYIGVYKVKDYMTTKAVTCRKSDSLFFALDTLNKNRISRLIITDSNGKPVGIISYDTFLRNSEYFKTAKQNAREYLIPPTSAKEMHVADITGNEILSVEDGEDLAKAARLMSQYKVSGLPVVDENGNLKGLISSSDIVRAYSEVETHFRLIKKDPHFD